MSDQAGNGSSGNGGAEDTTAQSFELKVGLAEMLKGGVIMDVVNTDQAKIAEDSGACAVMALERVPSDIRRDGGVARMCQVEIIESIQRTVSIPVMAKVRIGHYLEARVLDALGVDFIDESEVLTPADEEHHVDKVAFRSPFVCGARDLGEALRRISEGAAMIRTKGEAGRPRTARGRNRAFAGSELCGRRNRDAPRRRALPIPRCGGDLCRLGHLQERGSGGARTGDREGQHALG